MYLRPGREMGRGCRTCASPAADAPAWMSLVSIQVCIDQGEKSDRCMGGRPWDTATDQEAHEPQANTC